MPKTPILYREAFFEVIRGGPRDYLGHRPKRELEWYAVETELGTMVETRTSINAVDAVGKTVNADLTDMSISKFTEMDAGDFQNQYGTGGGSLIDINV